MTDDKRAEQVRRFINTVADAAIFDCREGITEYDPRNSGERLIGRLNLSKYRITPRKGDSKYARSIYTAVHWLYRTEQENDDD